MFIDRPTFSTLYSVQLPLLARGEGVQFTWIQTSGFRANEEVWQLDNIAILNSYELTSPLLSSFSGLEQSNSVMFYSGGNVEVSVILLCKHDMLVTSNYTYYFYITKLISM